MGIVPFTPPGDQSIGFDTDGALGRISERLEVELVRE